MNWRDDCLLKFGGQCVELVKFIKSRKLERVLETFVLLALLDPDIGKLLIGDFVICAVYFDRLKEVGIIVKPFWFFVVLIERTDPVVVAPSTCANLYLVAQVACPYKRAHV